MLTTNVTMNVTALWIGVTDVHTVESDVMIALGGRACVAAGRTDKDVSAVSQVGEEVLSFRRLFLMFVDVKNTPVQLI